MLEITQENNIESQCKHVTHTVVPEEKQPTLSLMTRHFKWQTAAL